MNRTDYDPAIYKQDKHGNLYPIDADSRYGVTLDDLREEEHDQ